ncbi:MAG: glycosyltransferase [Desulfobulbaceae bacterium]|nr:glycosyltransferase [Desulfobulbaceae bacterium]
MFTNTYLPHVGGVARSVSIFAEDLRAMGHNVLVVAPTFDHQPKNEDERRVLRVAAIQNFNGSDFSVRIPLPGMLEEKITDFRPDIIHSHHPFLLGDTALRMARLLDLPIVFTHHTLYEQYTHYVPFDSTAMKRFVIHLSTEYANLCNSVIAPSSSIKTLLEKRGVRTPVVVLPTGVDLNFFKNGKADSFRHTHNIPGDHKIIGHIGRLAREKNLPFLAAAVSGFLKNHREYSFVVAGSGDAEKEIKKIFARHSLAHRLIMPGILRGTELADCYKAMDVFVFASKSETQGLVLMEAMAAGVPVIAVRASGVSDVVEDRKNGRILRANCSEKTFARAIADAFEAEDIARWRFAALHTAARFSRERCASMLRELYEKNRSKTPGPGLYSDTLDNIRKKLQVEWELLQEKASAVMQTLA